MRREKKCYEQLLLLFVLSVNVFFPHVHIHTVKPMLELFGISENSIVTLFYFNTAKKKITQKYKLFTCYPCKQGLCLAIKP